VPIPQDLALQLVSFHLGRREQRGDMAEWLVNNATKLLHAGTLSAQGWSSLLQQHPELLFTPLRKAAAEDAVTSKWQPRPMPVDFALAVASLPDAEQLAVVQAALQWWRQQVGLVQGLAGVSRVGHWHLCWTVSHCQLFCRAQQLPYEPNMSHLC
jgi:hypothetical protein